MVYRNQNLLMCRSVFNKMLRIKMFYEQCCCQLVSGMRHGILFSFDRKAEYETEAIV